MVSDLLGDKASPLTVSLVDFVVSAGRASDLPAIADRVTAQAASARNKAIAEVRTAVELDAATIARLTTALNKATGKDVEVKTVIDPTVIGGVVTRIGDLIIDGTVSHRHRASPRNPEQALRFSMADLTINTQRRSPRRCAATSPIGSHRWKRRRSAM